MPKVSVAKKSSREPLSAARITAAAFNLVDTEGVAALSMRRLASLLGCQAMSLYHHVASIEGVSDSLVDALLERCPLPNDGPADRTSLLQLARDFLGLAEAHPRVFQLVVGRPWVSSKALALAMVLVRQFESQGMEARQALAAARVLGAYLNGAGMALAGWRLQTRVPGNDGHEDDSNAAWLRSQSNASAVHADIQHGLTVLLDSLLGTEPAGAR